MISGRGWLVVFAAAGLFAMVCSHAKAADKPRLSCWMVRQAAKIYKPDDLERMAKEAGLSDADIAQAKRCLQKK